MSLVQCLFRLRHPIPGCWRLQYHGTVFHFGRTRSFAQRSLQDLPGFQPAGGGKPPGYASRMKARLAYNDALGVQGQEAGLGLSVEASGLPDPCADVVGAWRVAGGGG